MSRVFCTIFLNCPNKFKSRSFRDALSGVSSLSEFPDLKLSSCHGLPALWISDEEMRALAVPFEFTLVGKFSSQRPSLEAIQKFFFLLKLTGNFSMTLLNSKNILVKFVNDLDYCRVFSHRLYFVGNCYMKLVKWSPLLDIDIDSPTIPIWVSFPNLRPHLFTPRILFGLGSLFGRPLRTDNATSNGLRPSVARVLVELDVTKKYSDFVWIGSETLDFRQRVELEEFLSYCDHCKVLGHSNVECCVLNPSLANNSLPYEDGVVKDVGDNNSLVDHVVLGMSGNSNEGDVIVKPSVLVNDVAAANLRGSVVENVQCNESQLETPVVGNHSILINLAEVHDDVVFNSGGGFKISGFYSPVTAGDTGCEVVAVADNVKKGVRKELDIVSAQTENFVVGEEASLGSGALVPDNLVDVPINVMSPTSFHNLVVSNLGVTCSGNSVWIEGYPSSGAGEGDLEVDHNDFDLYGLHVCKITEKALLHGKKRCRRKSRSCLAEAPFCAASGTTSWIISNLASSLEQLLSQFMPTVSSVAASSSSSIAQEDVTAAEGNSIQKRSMEDLSRLSRMLSRIQATLHDVEEREIDEKAIQLWLSELREVAYDAEDVLDQYDYQVIKTQLEGTIATTEEKPSLKWKRVDDDDIYGYQVSLPPSNSIKISISCDMAMRITEIIKKFDEIQQDRKELYLREEDAPRQPRFNDVMKRPPSSSLVLESNVFGREEEKRKIIQLLMSHSEKENTVIPIVGMGGVGKTTLAQLVYNDPEVCQHFSPKVWVCVSELFDVPRITKEIMSSIVDSTQYNDINNLNNLQCKLKDALLNKKFLLILDDVWNERADMWEALRAPFFGTGVGKIIITTRSMSVAHIMKTVSPIQLECLHDEKSWLLFQRHAFYGWELDQQLDFEQLGRRIAKKCGGLPLALNVIGGFLRNEFKEQTWKDVLNNNLWDPKEIILSALRISYNHLPSYLKPCFLYASLFPRDHYFQKLELIRMWIDQGYIQLTERKSLWEDIAVEYFEDLVRRSLFQYSIYHAAFTLHDMVHDLARSITRNEIFSSLDFDELKNIPKDAKHIFIKDTKVDHILQLGNIRTLYIYGLHYFSTMTLLQNSCSEIIFSHMRCLRVLRIHAPNFECSPKCIDSISYLQQLRYLSIYALKIQMTENSLCSLYKLQTLILQSHYINMLPHAIGKLISLRHLIIHNKERKLVLNSSFNSNKLLRLYICCSAIFYDNIDELYLSKYHVSRDGPYSSIKLLHPLNNLQGNLMICGIENVVDHEDAKSANLQSKPYIESLSFHWTKDECARNNEVVLEGLQPHTNLKKLTIDGYNGSSFPSWFGNPHFSNLTEIRLRLFKNKECQFLPLSKLPSLTSLEICSIRGITRMGQDFWCSNASPDCLENCSIEHVGFHSYEYLTNKSLLHCKERPIVKNGDFSSLKCLSIFECDSLQHISTLPSSLQKISVEFCKTLKYIELPYSSGHLSRLQEVEIHFCHNLKSVINLNNYLGTLKRLGLASCKLLKPNSDEDYDHSFGVPIENYIVRVYNCPGMKKWCQLHGFTYEKKNRGGEDDAMVLPLVARWSRFFFSLFSCRKGLLVRNCCLYFLWLRSSREAQGGKEKVSGEKVAELEAENKKSRTLIAEKEAALFGLESSRVIEDFKKYIAFKTIIQDHIQEAREHIYDVEVKALEQQCMDEGFTRDLDGAEIESELRKAFSSDDESVDVE
ncbi:hypothetical protein M5K25_021783 [Dendrobium thyrsiflorum]|uniref:Uncharacterized protein n=1 Tax=Dendrobium thyrsiflorum TaxID=117978 RepID=A0ABD0UAQ8_DENTH